MSTIPDMKIYRSLLIFTIYGHRTLIRGHINLFDHSSELDVVGEGGCGSISQTPTPTPHLLVLLFSTKRKLSIFEVLIDRFSQLRSKVKMSKVKTSNEKSRK
jgi:hypothetical protein